MQSRSSSISISYYAGVVTRKRKEVLRRILFRYMRGNIVIELFDYDSNTFESLCEDPETLHFKVSLFTF